jgi:hypothetical protein
MGGFNRLSRLHSAKVRFKTPSILRKAGIVFSTSVKVGNLYFTTLKKEPGEVNPSPGFSLLA